MEGKTVSSSSAMPLQSLQGGHLSSSAKEAFSKAERRRMQEAGLQLVPVPLEFTDLVWEGPGCVSC